MGIILIGERINGSFKDVGRAIQEHDKTVIQDRVARQEAGGADYLDVNGGSVAQAGRLCLAGSGDGGIH